VKKKIELLDKNINDIKKKKEIVEFAPKRMAEDIKMKVVNKYLKDFEDLGGIEFDRYMPQFKYTDFFQPSNYSDQKPFHLQMPPELKEQEHFTTEKLFNEPNSLKISSIETVSDV